MARRGKMSPGSVFAVDLGALGYAFGILAAGNDVAFLDLLRPEIPDLATISASKVLFRTYVAKDGLASGQWKIVGSIPLKDELQEPAGYRNQPVGSNKLFIYKAKQTMPASFDEAKDLEPLVTWFTSHIEERLRDHFEGRSNKAFEFLNRIKKYHPETGQEIHDD